MDGGMPPKIGMQLLNSIFGRKQKQKPDLQCVEPVSRVFGLDRGQPIDRFYIEQFLAGYKEDIRGRVLEIGDATYTEKFGGNRVVKSDVLHAISGNENATLVGNLATGEGVPVGA